MAEETFERLIARATEVCGYLEDEYPVDGMLCILTLLPAKSIHRFKLVCKPWCQLFSHPQFQKMHRGMFSIDPNNESVFFARPTAIESTKSSVYLINPDSNEKKLEPSIVPLPLSFSEEYPGCVDFLACFHGLVCMKCVDLPSTIALWNPATEWRKFVSNESPVKHLGETVSLGLGYDTEGDDFKVVRIVCMPPSKYDKSYLLSLLEVYSLNSDTWSEVNDVPIGFGVVEIDNKLVTVNGNPYWYLDNDLGMFYTDLVYFDVKKLKFFSVGLPPHFHSKGLRLVDWKGTLGTLECSHDEENNCSHLEVCVYDDSKKTWRHEFKSGRIEGKAVAIREQPFKNGNFLLYKDDGKWLVIYTDERRYSFKEKEIMIRADDGYGSNSFKIFGYTAALN